MKKIVKAIFVLSLMATPFILASCEKDHGTYGYGSYSDDDWKPRPSNDINVNQTPDAETSVINYNVNE